MLKIYLYCGALPDVGGGEVRRAESLVWRRLLERAVRELGWDAEVLSRLTVSERGRPYCPGAAFDFSPTHTKGLVAVAVCDCGRVGLDAEAKRGREIGRLLRVTDRWFTGEEQEKIRRAQAEGADAAEEMFLRVWTAKEALVKRTGAGLAGMRHCDSNHLGDCVLHTERIGDVILTVAAPQGTEPAEFRQIFF